MSKKIFAALIVAVVATLAGYNIYQSQRAKNTMSELAMANVEALADINETDSSGQTLYCCGNEDTIECGSDQTQVCYTIHVLNPETGTYYDHKIMGGKRN